MRRIALVGTSSTGTKAPFSREDWEIWGVSARGAHVTRATRWFELHNLSTEPEDWANLWRKTMRGFTHDIGQVLMLYPEPDLAPNVVAYPHERIVERFGTYFMTSTFAWMMALAIDELRPPNAPPVDGEIAIFGVEMEYGTEYRQQRSGFRHFIEIARVLGISVTRLAAGGLIYEPVPYPMWQDDPLLNKLEYRNTEARKRLAQFDDSIQMTRTMIAQNKAVMDAIMQSKQPGFDPDQRLRELERETGGLMDASAEISKQIVHLQGVTEEQAWLADYLQP